MRPLAQALAMAPCQWQGYHLAVAIDLFGDWDTHQVLGSRCLVARDWNHARSLVRQFSNSRHLLRRSRTSRKFDPGIAWIISGGVELEPKLLQTLESNGGRILGCDVNAIRFAKSPQDWCRLLQHVPEFRLDRTCPPGQWFLKSSWPAAERRSFWQQRIEGELLSALFMANRTSAHWIGAARLFVTQRHARSHSPQRHQFIASQFGEYHYLGNTVGEFTPSESQQMQMQDVADRFCQATGAQGLIGIDFIANPTVWPIEINPRPTASVELYSWLLQTNFYQQHVNVLQPSLTGTGPCQLPEPVVLVSDDPHDSPLEQRTSTHAPGTAPPTSRIGVAAKRIVYWPGDSALLISESLHQSCFAAEPLNLLARKILNSDIEVKLCDIPNVNTRVLPGHPLCTLLLGSQQHRQDLWPIAEALESQFLDQMRQ